MYVWGVTLMKAFFNFYSIVMSIPYIVRKKVGTIGDKKELWYAVPKKLQKKGGRTEKDIARLIQQRTGFHRGEVEGMLSVLTDIIEEELSGGHSVTIRGLGSFQTAISSKGFERPEQITPGEVKVSRVYFVANRDFTRRIKETPCFRIPFKYYFPQESITKSMQEMDKKQEDAE